MKLAGLRDAARLTRRNHNYTILLNMESGVVWAVETFSACGCNFMAGDKEAPYLQTSNPHESYKADSTAVITDGNRPMKIAEIRAAVERRLQELNETA